MAEKDMKIADDYAALVAVAFILYNCLQNLQASSRRGYG